MSLLGNNILQEFISGKNAPVVDPDLLYWAPFDGRTAYAKTGYEVVPSGVSGFPVDTYLGKRCFTAKNLSSGSINVKIHKDGASPFTTPTQFTQSVFACITTGTYEFLGSSNYADRNASTLQIKTEDINKFRLYNTRLYSGSFVFQACNYNEWHHWVIARDGTDAHFYLDGVKVKTIPFPEITYTRWAAIACEPIGVYGDKFNYYRHARGYSRVLTDAEILALSQEE